MLNSSVSSIEEIAISGNFTRKKYTHKFVRKADAPENKMKSNSAEERSGRTRWKAVMIDTNYWSYVAAKISYNSEEHKW